MVCLFWPAGGQPYSGFAHDFPGPRTKSTKPRRQEGAYFASRAALWVSTWNSKYDSIRQDEICASTSCGRPKSCDNRPEKQLPLGLIVAAIRFLLRLALPGVRNASSGSPALSVPPQQRIEEQMNLQERFDKYWLEPALGLAFPPYHNLTC